MPSSSQYNNYNPFSGFNPGEALSQVRSQMMDAYGQMQAGGQAGGGGQQVNQQVQQNGYPGWGGQGGGQPQGWGGMANWGGVQNQWQSQYGMQNNPFMQQPMSQPAIQPMPQQNVGLNPYNRGYQQPMQQANPLPMAAPDPMQVMQQSGGGIGGGAGMFGLPVGQGAPGGSGVDWLSDLGMPIPQFLQQISDNQAVGPGNYNDVLQQLGGVGGLPSLQSLQNLNPSEQEFLAGFFETVLGIPFNDVVAAAARPFAGLGNAQQSRTAWR